MKQNKIFTLLLGFGFAGLVACNNDSNTTADNKDSGNNTAGTNATNTNTSAGDYSAYADEIEKNSSQGVYVNPRTGKKYSKLTVNRTTGEVTDENNQPVWRYVDTRDWWVYGVDDDWNWTRLGEAKMESDNLVFKSDDDKWVTYDERWKVKDDDTDQKWKSKPGDAKIKFSKDGDIKIKDKDGKVKYDADDNKVKTDSSRK